MLTVQADKRSLYASSRRSKVLIQFLLHQGQCTLPNMYTFADCYSVFVASDPHLAFNSQSTGIFMLQGSDAHTESFIYATVMTRERDFTLDNILGRVLHSATVALLLTHVCRSDCARGIKRTVPANDEWNMQLLKDRKSPTLDLMD